MISLKKSVRLDEKTLLWSHVDYRGRANMSSLDDGKKKELLDKAESFCMSNDNSTNQLLWVAQLTLSCWSRWLDRVRCLLHNSPLKSQVPQIVHGIEAFILAWPRSRLSCLSFMFYAKVVQAHLCPKKEHPKKFHPILLLQRPIFVCHMMSKLCWLGLTKPTPWYFGATCTLQYLVVLSCLLFPCQILQSMPTSRTALVPKFLFQVFGNVWDDSCKRIDARDRTSKTPREEDLAAYYAAFGELSRQ